MNWLFIGQLLLAFSTSAAELCPDSLKGVPARTALSLKSQILSQPYSRTLTYASRKFRQMDPMPAERAGQFLDLDTSSIPLDLGMHVEFFSDRKKEEPHVVMLMTQNSRLNLAQHLGFNMVTISRTKTGEYEAQAEGFYFNRESRESARASLRLMRFVYGRVYPKLHIRRETILADFSGRYLWATQGFVFDPHPSRQYLDVASVGVPRRVKAAELMRRNLLRFLNLGGLKVTDLLRRLPDGTRVAVQNLNELETPYDFVTLVEKNGAKFLVNPMLSERELGPARALSIGRAFAMATHAERTDSENIASSAGHSHFSAYVMPRWYGIKTFPESESRPETSDPSPRTPDSE